MVKNKNNNTTVLLAGASGYIGAHVKNILVDDGYKVLPVFRKSNSTNAIISKDCLQVDFLNALSVSSFFNNCPDINVIISCIGSRRGGKIDSWQAEFSANKILLELGLKKKAHQFILLSAICVQKPMLEFQYAKLAFEKELIRSNMTYSIVRPTAFFKSLSGQLDRIKKGKSFIIFDSGENTWCKPISENDTARYLVDCIRIKARKNKILPIGGSTSPISSKTIGRIIFRLTGKKPRFKSVPSVVFKLADKALSPLSFFSPKIRDFREFLRIANYYATQSMLCWNEKLQRYDSTITPEFGKDTLEEHLKKMIKTKAPSETGHHKLF